MFASCNPDFTKGAILFNTCDSYEGIKVLYLPVIALLFDGTVYLIPLGFHCQQGYLEFRIIDKYKIFGGKQESN
jgi:hypothetical protein